MGARYLFVLGVFLASCSSTVPRHPDFFWSESEKESLTIFYTRDRKLELRPCGCTINPMGGIEREWKLLSDWKNKLKRSHHLAFAGGRTFLPEGATKNSLKGFRPATPFLARAYKKLGYSAIFPATEDFHYGWKHINSLQKASDLPWVTTNIHRKNTNEPAFREFVGFQYGKTKVVAISLMGPGKFLPEGFVVKDPRETLAKLMKKSYWDGATLLVVVTNLSRRQMDELVRDFPRINVVLGGDKTNYLSMDQGNRNTVFLTTKDQGKQVGAVTVALRERFEELASNTARKPALRRVFWQDRLEEAKQGLKAAKGEKEKRDFLADIAYAKLKLAQYNELSEGTTPMGVPVTMALKSVTLDYVAKTTPMDKLVEDFSRVHMAPKAR